MAVRRIVANLAGDPAAAQAFYSGVLGLDAAMDLGWITTFAHDGAQVSVLARDATAPVVAAVSVEVDDVDEVHAAALAAGLEIVHPLTDEPWGVRRFFVCDPNGHVVNVLTHASDAG